MCRALVFLEDRRIIHRDIAARNIFIGRSLAIVKLGDFGLARDLYHSTDLIYLARTEQRIPFKWMAPESIRDLRCTTKSDTWSFGVLCFELTSFGAVPYNAMSTVEMIQYLVNGNRLPQPVPYCLDALYTLMLECWAFDPMRRPAFTTILEKLICLPDLYSHAILDTRIAYTSSVYTAPTGKNVATLTTGGEFGGTYDTADVTPEYIAVTETSEVVISVPHNLNCKPDVQIIRYAKHNEHADDINSSDEETLL